MPDVTRGFSLINKENSYDFAMYVPGHHNSRVHPKKEISPDEHQNILAAMIGDGCLLKNTARGTYRLAWNMGNKPHALSKLEAFSGFNSSYNERDNPGFGEKWYQVRTSCWKGFDYYAEKYGNSRNGYNCGLISSELNALGWAIYFGDDGHSSVSNNHLTVAVHTEGFTESQCNEIAVNLENFIGVYGGVSVKSYIGGTKKRKMFFILLTSSEAKYEFFKKITPHMENGVEYKIKLDSLNYTPKK